MGRIRIAHLAVSSFFAAAAVALLIAALVIPYWQWRDIAGKEVRRNGLWGFKSCLLTDCGDEKLQRYPDCLSSDQVCKDNRKANSIAAGGLIAQCAICGLFLLYCLAKLHSGAKHFAETGFFGWLILPLPFFGAIVGSVCWGLYFHYNPYRKDTNDWHWGPCLWIALAGWICGFLAWVPRLYYRFS